MAFNILFFGVLFHVLDPLPGKTFWEPVYFSGITFTTLGYGDIVPSGTLRMMAGAEALNGLLLIGWSASYAHIAMERFWQNGEHRPQ